MKEFLLTLTSNWWGIVIICTVALCVWILLSALLYRVFFKRFYDILLSGLAILILSPIFLVLIILGAIKMKGNPFFTQKRPGKTGKDGKEKIFKLIKFRTMSNAKDKDGNLLPDDVRLNKYGRILRSTSLDELPELFNIFIGNMSIVGPRPLLVEYLSYYTVEERHRHDVRPGLTGWAQVNGRNVTRWNERLQQDVYYVKNCSLLLDLKILFKTVTKVLKRSDILVGEQHGEGHGKLDKVRLNNASKGKMLVLGSDYVTLQVVKEAVAEGVYVIVTDLMKMSPTKAHANEIWNISTTDIDLLEKLCREQNVTSIMFGASDFNITNGRELCKRLNLPIYCASDYAWEVARNKGEFKRLCKAYGAPVAQDYYLTDDLDGSQLNKVEFPVVVKPVDKSGNRGMSYCNNKKELIVAYKKAREISEKEIIVEKCLSGSEYNVHYALADGKASLLYFSATHSQPTQSKNLYSFKCTTALHLKQFIEEVNDSLVKVFEKAECKEGIVWVDCIRDDNDGKFYLLEMGHRFGGVMTYVPYEKVTGFNTVKWMVDYALGKKRKVTDLPKPLNQAYKACAASYHLFTAKEGVIGKIKGLNKLSKLSNVYIDIPKSTGDAVRHNACMGLIGIYAKDDKELCDTLKKINKYLKIKDEKGQNLIIYYNDYETLKNEYIAGQKEFS